jgi:hypothetical protein
MFGYHLNFQNQFDFCFVLKRWFPKNHCENMGLCLFFGKKRKTLKNSWYTSFVSKRCGRYVICMKTHDLINRKGSFDRESLVALWAKLPTRLKQVETDMIKRRTIIGQAPSSHSVSKLCPLSWTSSRIHIAFLAPYSFHQRFEVSRVFRL